MAACTSPVARSRSARPPTAATRGARLGERTVNGYLYRDDHISPLVEVEHRTQFDPDYLHHDLELSVRDEDGREVTLTARRNAAFKLDFAARCS